jgi:hypothetical protein
MFLDVTGKWKPSTLHGEAGMVEEESNGNDTPVDEKTIAEKS